MSGKLPFDAPEKAEELACIKDLIGPSSKRGIVCPCATCRAERGEPPEDQDATAPQPPRNTAAAVRDRKMESAGEASDSANSADGLERSLEAAERIYLERMRTRNSEL